MAEKKKPGKKLIEKITKDLLSRLDLKVEAVVKEEEGLISIQLETEDPGILIGYHGETLAALQLILAKILYRQTGEWSRILVNVGDYRERRQESLEKMALSAAQRVKFSGEAQVLPAMNAAERRMVHLALANDSEIATESEGEAQNRRVVIKPKSQ